MWQLLLLRLLAVGSASGRGEPCRGLLGPALVTVSPLAEPWPVSQSSAISAACWCRQPEPQANRSSYFRTLNSLLLSFSEANIHCDRMRLRNDYLVIIYCSQGGGKKRRVLPRLLQLFGAASSPHEPNIFRLARVLLDKCLAQARVGANSA